MNTTGCCDLIDPAVYDGKQFDWTGRAFIKTRIRSVFHMPLNFRSCMQRLMKQAELAHASVPKDQELWVTDENSLWGADLYMLVSKPISGAENASLPGVWRAKVFEGPFKNMRQWIDAMKPFKRLLTFYTVCPKCAKTYGKNYVVLFAQ